MRYLREEDEEELCNGRRLEGIRGGTLNTGFCLAPVKFYMLSVIL